LVSYQFTWRHIPEDCSLFHSTCENLKLPKKKA
jgi:hypothetical protein